MVAGAGFEQATFRLGEVVIDERSKVREPTLPARPSSCEQGRARGAASEYTKSADTRPHLRGVKLLIAD
jgi:hypothetical protein